MNTVQIIVATLLAFLILACAMLAGFTWWITRKVRSALPPQGRTIVVAGGAIHVHEQGEGPPLLLIHGLAGNMRHYTYGVTERLSKHFRVLTIDRPGSGYSKRPATTPADLTTQAAAIAALLDQLKLPQVFVVGHSLGGAVALTLAVEHAPRVSGLALVAPLTHLPDDPNPPAAFRTLTISSSWLRKLFAWTLAVPGSIAKRDVVLDQVFGPEAVPRDFAVRGGGLMGLYPHQFIAASRDLQAIPERLPAIVARYGELRTPLRILFGRNDRILDWKANGQALADKVAGATLTLIDGGHMLPVTQAAEVADFIRETVELAVVTPRP